MIRFTTRRAAIAALGLAMAFSLLFKLIYQRTLNYPDRR